MNLSQINFPVYVLGNQKPLHNDNIDFYVYVKKVVEGDDLEVVKVVDDKNLPGMSLASRRLKLKEMGATMHSIGKAVFFLGDLIKLAKTYNWFIDSVGTIFEYQKTKRVPLVFKPITGIQPLKSGGAIVEVQHIPHRFKVLLAPNGNEKWAGILQVGAGYILYGLYEEQQKDTYRMI